MEPIRLISFGYLHLPTGPDGQPVPPAADRIEDVRDLDGFHPRVQDVVLNTPGARELLANLADYADLPAGPRRIGIGCAGGRHRACGLTEILARELRAPGHSQDIAVRISPFVERAHTRPGDVRYAPFEVSDHQLFADPYEADAMAHIHPGTQVHSHDYHTLRFH